MPDRSYTQDWGLTMKVPGGTVMNVVMFEQGIQEVAISLIGFARELVDLPVEAEKGSRFNDTANVLWRLESMFSEDEFVHDSVKTINAALIDAAKSDYWYAHEEQWDYTYDADEYEWESDAC